MSVATTTMTTATTTTTVMTLALSAIAVMYEVEDFLMWLPGADQSARKASLSMFRFIIRISGWKPW